MNNHMITLKYNFDEYYWEVIEIIEETETKYDFTFHPDFDGMGAYADSEVFISPRKHETLEELIATINHESLHAAIEFCDMDQVHNHKEHWAISKIQWIDEYV